MMSTPLLEDVAVVGGPLLGRLISRLWPLLTGQPTQKTNQFRESNQSTCLPRRLISLENPIESTRLSRKMVQLELALPEDAIK